MVLIYGGCDLFAPRDVEPPSDPRSNFTPPTIPDFVIVNLQFAIAEKNLNNYMQCLTDSAFSGRSFRFFADVSSQVQYPILNNWSVNQERTYYTNLISLTEPSATSNLFVSNEQMQTGLDSAIYDADYLLVFSHNQNTVAKTVKGKLRFILKPDTRNLWSINTWSDFKVNSSDTTWSVLKANFSN